MVILVHLPQIMPLISTPASSPLKKEEVASYLSLLDNRSGPLRAGGSCLATTNRSVTMEAHPTDGIPLGPVRSHGMSALLSQSQSAYTSTNGVGED